MQKSRAASGCIRNEAGSAAGIGNTRRVRLKNAWSEPVIVWTALVVESGEHKSPAIDYAKRFPDRREIKARKEYAEAQKKYQVDKEEFELQVALIALRRAFVQHAVDPFHFPGER
jgi:hypothetical protein